MFKHLLHFIKYNNATILILVVIFIIGSGAWAQTEAGQEFIGEQQISSEGVDNTLLLAADLDIFDMEFKIEKIEEDSDYFYVTYTYMDLVLESDAWQYQVTEGLRKVSKKLKQDLGEYLAEELKEEYEQRIKELKAEQALANELEGVSTRVEVSEYSGLIGTTLNLVGQVFDDYEPVKTYVIPSPSVPPSVLANNIEEASPADDLTDIYNDYINENDPDRDDVFGVLDNCPDDFNPGQEDADGDDIGDACDPYFTLTPVEEDVSTTTGETATSSEDSLENSEQKTENSTATSSDEQVEESTEPDVIIVDYDDVVGTSTN